MFTLFSDHNGSLLKRQPRAMTIGHSPKPSACMVVAKPCTASQCLAIMPSWILLPVSFDMLIDTSAQQPAKKT